MDMPCYRRIERTSPILVNLVERGKPVSLLLGREEKPQGQPMAVRVGGWEKANAALSWDGYGLQHHPTRKRADFPAVSRHENHRGIGREGVANVGGFVPLVLPSPQGHRLLCSIVQPAGGTTADGSFTRPSRCLSRMKGNFHVRLCVQRRLACSGGGKPTRGKARALSLGEQGDGKPTF